MTSPFVLILWLTLLPPQPFPESIQSDVIRITHIGPEDKTIPALVIAKIPTEGISDEVIVTEETFQLLLQELRTSPLKNSAPPPEPDFGTFRITLSAAKEESFFLSTRANAIRFFTTVRDAVRQRDRLGPLENHLTYLLSRIE